jgi:SAM-dependent methyltransferase
VCGGRSHAHLYDVNDYPIVRCRECGFVFVGVAPSSAQLLSLYDERYYEYSDHPGYGGYAAAERRKRLHDRTLLRELESKVGPGAILEVGCAYGYFLDEARGRGWRVRGVEPSEFASRQAQERLGLDVVSAVFTQLPVERDSQDAIAMWDVIEHLPNPREAITTAHEWLRPRGVLALSTGDVGSLTARLHGRDWSLMTPPWHQSFFSRRTLRRLLETGGFEPIGFKGDGNFALDRSSRRPRIRGPLAAVLKQPLVTAIARRLGAGGIMFAFARKPSP